jgi:hypothetical protein
MILEEYSPCISKIILNVSKNPTIEYAEKYTNFSYK